MNNDERVLTKNNNNRKSSHSVCHRGKFRIVTIFIPLFIIADFVFSLFSNKNKPDINSEKIIYEEAAKILNKNSNELTDDDFLKITRFKLENTNLCDIKLIEKFFNLEELNIYGVYSGKNIPVWIAYLALYGNYADLFYKRTEVDLRPLEKLSKLQSLSFMDSSVRNIKSLSNLINIKELNLYATNVSDLKPLQGLLNLQSLNIESTFVSTIEPIKGLHNLRILNLFDTLVTDLEPIKELNNLQELWLSLTQIDNLEPLKGLKNLEWINLQYCPNITDDQVKDLQKALPKLEIIR